MSRYDPEDVALVDLPAHEPASPEREEADMAVLKLGTILSPPDLAGRWSVWSQSSEAPGAYFITPADDEAKALGAKYAVIKAIARRGDFRPEIKTLRTDPPVCK